MVTWCVAQRSLHLEGDDEDGIEGSTRVVDTTNLTEDQESHCKTTSEGTLQVLLLKCVFLFHIESVARYDTPRVPKLPEPSTMVLRPNHEAFFDEGIGAPVAKSSTLSIESNNTSFVNFATCFILLTRF